MGKGGDPTPESFTRILCVHMARKCFDGFRCWRAYQQTRSKLCTKLEVKLRLGLWKPKMCKDLIIFNTNLIFFQSLHFRHWWMALFLLVALGVGGSNAPKSMLPNFENCVAAKPFETIDFFADIIDCRGYLLACYRSLSGWTMSNFVKKF